MRTGHSSTYVRAIHITHLGERLDQSKWSEILDEFYEAHGWAYETGQQTRDGLLRLSLRDVWQKLEEHSGN